jgi:hypothetical protein
VVVTKLYGGLGNQMFQYAAGLGVATRLGTRLIADASWFFPAPDPDRAYELSAFGIDPSIGLADRLRLALRRKTVHREPHYEYDAAVETLAGTVVLDGYWQHERYFAHCAAEVREAFHFRQALPAGHATLLAEIRAEESASLHVRRGDYTAPKRQRRFGLLPLSYYEAAMALVRERAPGVRFTVFSDDLDWCREHLDGERLRFCPEGSGAADMQLMAACKHNVVANSSFSWWGAWLNANAGKTVVAPRQWFQDPALRDSSPAPPEWIRL